MTKLQKQLLRIVIDKLKSQDTTECRIKFTEDLMAHGVDNETAVEIESFFDKNLNVLFESVHTSLTLLSTINDDVIERDYLIDNQGILND